MADLYESRHTGAEIDDAIDRAKSGGDIDQALDGKIPASEKGAANGVAELGADGKVPAGQLTISVKKTVTLSTAWSGDASPYTQTVTISGMTANSKVDLQPDAAVIAQMAEDGTVALYIANDNGTLTAYAVGEKPTAELTIQATITEVSA